MSETTRALARLPSMDIELVHDRSEDGSAERLAIRLTGRPSLEAASRMVERDLLQQLLRANPWLQMQQELWRQAMAPWVRLNPFLAPLLPPPAPRD